MRRLTWGKGYEVAREDINELQENIEQATEFLATFVQAKGIYETVTLPEDQREGAFVPAFPSPNIGGRVRAFNAININGETISLESLTDLTLTVDLNGASTAVTTSGNERWVSIFIEPRKINEERRIDDDQQEYFRVQRDSVRFRIVKSDEFLATLPAQDKDLLRPAKSNASWLFLGDVLFYFGLTGVQEVDIYRNRKEGITGGNANLINFNNTAAYYSGGVTNVEQALEEVMSYITGPNTPDSVREIQRRYYQFSSTNIRLFFDKPNNLVYAMKAEKYDIVDVKQSWNATRTGVAFQANVGPGRNLIVFRTHSRSIGDYSKEVVLDEGLVFKPKIFWNAGEWAVTWIWEDPISGLKEIRFWRVNDTVNINDPQTSGAKITNINDKLTYNAENWYDSNIYDVYNVAYDSVNDKYGIIWSDDGGRILMRTVERTTGTLSSIVQIDNSGVTSYSYELPAIIFKTTQYFVSYRSQDTDTLFLAVVSDVLAIVTAEFEPGGPILFNRTNILYDRPALIVNIPASNNILITGLDADNQQMFLFRQDTTDMTPTGFTIVGNWAGVGNADYFIGAVWNTAISNIAVFFSEDGTSNRILYREMSQFSVAGTNTAFTGTDDTFYTDSVGHLSNPQYESGGNDNYRFVSLHPTRSFPFELREMDYRLAADQGSATQAIEDYHQGDGGNFNVVLGYNVKKSYKVSFSEYDGDSITLNNNFILKADIPLSDFTNIVVEDKEINLTITDVVARGTFVYTYERIKVLTRVDNTAINGIIVGNSSDVARTDREYFASPPLIQPAPNNDTIVIDQVTGDVSVGIIDSANILTNSNNGANTNALNAEDIELGANGGPVWYVSTVADLFSTFGFAQQYDLKSLLDGDATTVTNQTTTVFSGTFSQFLSLPKISINSPLEIPQIGDIVKQTTTSLLFVVTNVIDLGGGTYELYFSAKQVDINKLDVGFPITVTRRTAVVDVNVDNVDVGISGGNNLQLISKGAPNGLSTLTSYSQITPSQFPYRDALQGLEYSVNPNLANGTSLGTGWCFNHNGTVRINVSSPLTFDASFIGVGGMDNATAIPVTTGLLYYLYLIAHADGSNPACVISGNQTTPSISPPYTIYRRIGMLISYVTVPQKLAGLIARGNKEKYIQFSTPAVSTTTLMSATPFSGSTNVNLNLILPIWIVKLKILSFLRYSGTGSGEVHIGSDDLTIGGVSSNEIVIHASGNNTAAGAGVGDRSTLIFDFLPGPNRGVTFYTPVASVDSYAASLLGIYDDLRILL